MWNYIDLFIYINKSESLSMHLKPLTNQILTGPLELPYDATRIAFQLA